MINQFHFVIITPSYNQNLFIGKTIRSVLSQRNNFSIDYWVIDGKSTDGTLNTLRKYESKLNWISEVDRGQTDAINKGIKLTKKLLNSKYTIFAYINSDDYYLPNVFKKVIENFKLHPRKMWLVGDSIIIDKDNKEIQKIIRFYKSLFRKTNIKIILNILNPIPQPSVFIRGNALIGTGLFKTDLKYTMDYDYWHRLLNKYGTPIFIKDPLSAFRIHSLSKGGSQFINQFNEELCVAKRNCDNLFLIYLHTLHNFIIKFIYSLIK